MRRPFRLLVLLPPLFAAAALARPAYALDLDEIVQRHVDALGGKAKIAALQSLQLTGRLTVGVGDDSFNVLWTRSIKRPGMIRDEVSLQGLTAVYAFDGK